MYEEARPTQEVEVFIGLEKLYYAIASKRPDVELSLEVISHILPLYGGLSTREIFNIHLFPAFEKHRQELEVIYSQVNEYNEYEDASAFFFQPEAILLYERLHHDRYELMHKWNERYPERELVRVAENFGFSFE